MANQLLNSNVITNAALEILHQKLNVIRTVNRAYDKSFSQEGAKIGNTLRIRLPNQYQISRGPALNVQDMVENNTTLTVSSQAHVDVNFTSTELALNIFDFSQQFLEPAMRVLAANIENDFLNGVTAAQNNGVATTGVLPLVYNQVNNHGSACAPRQLAQARKLLIDNLVPPGDLALRVNTQDNVDLIDSTKGLFNATTDISEQYRSGVFAKGFGFDSIAENTFLSTFTTGAGSRTAYIVNGANQTGASLVVSTGTGAFNIGEVFTIPGVFRVHPETKLSTNVLQQFVVTAAYAGGGGTLNISPALVTSGPTQNVSGSPANSAALTFAGTASTANGISLAYHKDAFTFATADLILPDGVHFAGRKMQDGISLRVVRQYDINNDKFPCRIDVLYGYAAIRPQLAARMVNN